jgi:hypothetical protein
MHGVSYLTVRFVAVLGPRSQGHQLARKKPRITSVSGFQDDAARRRTQRKSPARSARRAMVVMIERRP